VNVEVHRVLVAEDVRRSGAPVLVPEGVDDASPWSQHAHGAHDLVLVEGHRVGSVDVLEVAREVGLDREGPVDVARDAGGRADEHQVAVGAHGPRARGVGAVRPVPQEPRTTRALARAAAATGSRGAT